MSGVGKTGSGTARDTFTIWYICIPENEDREIYIKNCFLSGIVMVVNENGEFKKAKIGKLSIQIINFPETKDGYGSEVACLSNSYNGQLYVVDVFNTSGQYLQQKENQYRFVKQNGIGSASQLIDGNGNITMTVDGSEANGVVTINISNQNRAGKLNINVNGDILIQNDGTTTLKSTNKVLIDSPKIYLNESKEPILLGQKTVDLLSDLLDQLNIESAGPYPLLGNSKYATIKQGLEDLKSEFSFVK